MNQPAVAILNIPAYPVQVAMNLTTTCRGLPALVQPSCMFSYTLDYKKGRGCACLCSIDNSPINIPLYPLGGEGLWDFVSTIRPTSFLAGDQSITIYRVAFNVDLFTHEASAALLLDACGTAVLSTDNFDPFCTALNRHDASIYKSSYLQSRSVNSWNGRSQQITSYKALL